jgi:hypothetical protein
MKSVYCAVRTGSLNKAVCASYLKGLMLTVPAQLKIRSGGTASAALGSYGREYQKKARGL